MVRVTRSGGTVAAYAWDIPGRGVHTEPMRDAMADFGIGPLQPLRAEIPTILALENIAKRSITVERDFRYVDEWWCIIRGASSLASASDRLTSTDAERLNDVTRERLPARANGHVRYSVWANAIVGTKPHCSGCQGKTLETPFYKLDE